MTLHAPMRMALHTINTAAKLAESRQSELDLLPSDDLDEDEDAELCDLLLGDLVRELLCDPLLGDLRRSDSASEAELPFTMSPCSKTFSNTHPPRRLPAWRRHP